MIYADYSYYTDEYFGNAISEEDFPRMEARASRYIDYITQGKAAKVAAVGMDGGEIITAVKNACCELAEQYQLINQAQTLAKQSLAAASDGGAELQGETVGAWSRSYRSGGDSAQSATQAAKDAEAALYAIAQRYLVNTGMLYRGGRRCQCDG